MKFRRGSQRIEHKEEGAQCISYALTTKPRHNTGTNECKNASIVFERRMCSGGVRRHCHSCVCHRAPFPAVGLAGSPLNR